MLNKSGGDAAVSPVIGTILLVAISVVLVAIIITVVMGFANGDDGKKVGLNAKPSGNGVDAQLIVYGGASLSELMKLEMIDQDSPFGEYVEIWNASSGDVNVGLPYLAEKVARSPEARDVYDTRINVLGTFTDGTEVVLLVQPLTFFNVAGFGKKDPNEPEISEPVIKSADETTVNKILYVSYSNTITAPSNLTIHYQPQGKPEEKISIDCGKGSIVPSDKSRSFQTGVVTLKQNVTYEIWGELTIDGKNYAGPVKIYKLASFTILIPTAKVSSESNMIWEMNLGYVNAPTVPTNVVFCYRQKGADEGSEVRVDLGAGTKTTEGFASVMKIAPGKQYIFWAEVTIDGEVNVGPNGELGIMSPSVNPSAKISGDKITTQKLSASYQYAPSDVSRITVYYYPEHDPTNVKSISKDGSWPYYSPFGDERTTITGSIEIGDVDLQPGTYILQAEIDTSDGSFKGGTRTLTIPSITFGKPSVTVHEDRGLNRTVTVTYKNAPSVPTKTTINYQQMNGGEYGEINLGIGVSSSTNTIVTAKITFDAPTRFYDVWLELETPDGIFESEKVTHLSSIAA